MMLIIRASLLSSHDKIVAQPHYDPKDGQFAKNELLTSFREIVTLRHYDQKDCRFLKFFCTTLNHPFCLVIFYLSSEWLFGAVSVKFSLNLITKIKMTNLQNTVRRLIIILFSLFFLLLIRASIWINYGKNFAEPCYDQKDDQFCKVLSHASQSSFLPSFMVSFIKPTFWNSYYKILVEPHYEGSDDQFAKYFQMPRNHRFQEVCCCWLSVRSFGALTVKFAPNPIVEQNMANLRNTVTGLLLTDFALVYLCVSCKQHFGVLTVKFLLHEIITCKMASLENIVTRLRIIPFI